MRIHDSFALTASLSAVHVVGMTVLAGSALVSNLRLLGVLLPNHAVSEVTSAARKGVAVGLGISIVTGVLLFFPRARAAAANDIFQLKMLLLFVAAAFYLLVSRPMAVRDEVSPLVLRATGAVSLVLWLSVVGAGAAYILLNE